MRYLIVFLVLLTVKALARIFYRVEVDWVGDEPADPWCQDYRIVSILNHTSLFEILYLAIPSNRFIWRMARHGVVPIAAKTINRPIVGKFWRLIAGNVVSVTRERDHTWAKVIGSIEAESMVLILPEGRMKRGDGRDSFGRQLVVRGGIADLLRAAGSGKWLMCYSLGLHHIQVPGQTFPRLFKTVRMRFEVLDVGAYCATLGADELDSFKAAVVGDLTDRRDRYCTSDLGGEDVEAAPAPES